MTVPIHDIMSTDRETSLVYLCEGQVKQNGVMMASITGSGLLPVAGEFRITRVEESARVRDQRSLAKLHRGIKMLLNTSPVYQELLCKPEGCEWCRETLEDWKATIEGRLEVFEFDFSGLCLECINDGTQVGPGAVPSACTLHT